MGESLFIPVEDAAMLLGVSKDLVYELIKRGEFPSTTLGRRRLVPRRAIDEVLERAMAGFDPDRLVSELAKAAS